MAKRNWRKTDWVARQPPADWHPGRPDKVLEFFGSETLAHEAVLFRAFRARVSLTGRERIPDQARWRKTLTGGRRGDILVFRGRRGDILVFRGDLERIGNFELLRLSILRL